MRVLQVNKLYHPHIGGVEKVVKDIADGLKDKVDMEVLACQPKGKMSEAVINGVKVSYVSSIGIYFSMPLSFSFASQLKKLSKDKDILHFHMPFPLGDISYLLMKPRGKVVVWWHSDIIRQKNMLKLYRPLLIKFLKRVDKILVATPRHIESSNFLKNFTDKCEVIPFGADVDQFQLNDKVRKKVEIIREKCGSRIILSIGRLIYYKGFEYLIRAMKNVDAKLLIIGEGHLEGSLRKLAAELEIESKIVFLSKIDNEELLVYYYACDIFVLPSIANSEAFGIVQLEAMACGKPVINTDLPTGVPYVSLNGQTGITVPPADSKALSQAIHILLENFDLRKKYGENAFARVKTQFSLRTMIDKVYNVYEEVMEH